MIGGFFTRRADFEIFEMMPDDCADTAAIHAERFRRAWSEEEIHSMLGQTAVFGFLARQTGAVAAAAGFVLARAAAGEAEILTIAASAQYGRSGLGWRLMRAAIREAQNRGAVSMFLEVDETNTPARALSRTLGFARVGERKGYYDDRKQGKTAAIVMRLDLNG